MQFASPASHYDRFMGRYTQSLAPELCDVVPIESGDRVLDVGCGPGGLAAELAARAGESNIAAIDPAAQFAAACSERLPQADVREGVAEKLPWDDGEFDASLSCLVIAFMADPDQGVSEMARVTKSGGTVAACMWDIVGGGMSMLRIFWTAMREVRPDTRDEQDRPGTKEGDIAERFTRAGLTAVTAGALHAQADYTGFDDFWDPFTFQVGPAGQALAALGSEDQVAVRDACRRALPEGPFSLDARAWYARGTVA